MKSQITFILFGSLAIVLGYNSNTTSINLNEYKSLLSSVFPAGNVPQNPDSESSASDPYPRQMVPMLEDTNPSDSRSLVKSRKVVSQIPQTQQEVRNGPVYTYEVPLYNDNEEQQKESYNGGGEIGIDLDGSSGGNESVNQYQPQSEDDGNNAKENTKEYKETIRRKNKKNHSENFVSSQHAPIKQKRIKLKKKVWKGNDSQVIEGAAGINYHQLAHPEGPYEHGNLGQHVGQEYQIPHQQIIQLPIQKHHEGHSPIVLHHPEPVHGPVHHPEVIHLEHAGHHESHAKPLKPSVVHRDPHDSYDHHDKIRTQDKDRLHHDPKMLGHSYGHEYGHNEYGAGYVSGFQPYHYDMHKIPECAHKNKHFYNLTFCLEDHAYPLETVLWAIHASGPYAHQLHSDVTYQSADNLVDGLTRAEEEGYTYKHYFGATHAQHTHLEQYKPPYHGYTYKTDYFKKGGYICPSDIYYGRPKRAMNTYGKWKVIVNVDQIPKAHHGHEEEITLLKKKREIYHKGHKQGFTQTLRLEQCIYPNAPCSFIDSHYHSKCIQKHNFVRLVAWTHEEGLHVDTFKMPIACSCHIPQPIHFFQESGHHEERRGEIVPPVNGYEAHHSLPHLGKK